MPRVLRGLDALLCSSTSEGFSLTICQALASGIPVVSTRCGGPEEILQHSAFRQGGTDIHYLETRLGLK